jgi:hypothetical protein
LNKIYRDSNGKMKNDSGVRCRPGGEKSRKQIAEKWRRGEGHNRSS